MLLTRPESEFLGALIDEYMAADEGPATRAIQALELVASDYLHLLDAYSRANPPKLERREVNGGVEDVLVWGRPSLHPPAPPWPDRDAVRRRNAELLAERRQP